MVVRQKETLGIVDEQTRIAG
jgi:hypothetical protein